MVRMPLTGFIDGKRVLSLDFSSEEWRELKQACHKDKNHVTLSGGESAFPRTSHRKVQHFVTRTGQDRSATAPETVEHEVTKYAVYRTLRSLGWEAYVEYQSDCGSWVADVLGVSPEGRKVAFEVQLSLQSEEDFVYRTQRYKDSGVDVLWITPFLYTVPDDMTVVWTDVRKGSGMHDWKGVTESCAQFYYNESMTSQQTLYEAIKSYIHGEVTVDTCKLGISFSEYVCKQCGEMVTWWKNNVTIIPNGHKNEPPKGFPFVGEADPNFQPVMDSLSAQGVVRCSPAKKDACPHCGHVPASDFVDNVLDDNTARVVVTAVDDISCALGAPPKKVTFASVVSGHVYNVSELEEFDPRAEALCNVNNRFNIVGQKNYRFPLRKFLSSETKPSGASRLWYADSALLDGVEYTARNGFVSMSNNLTNYSSLSKCSVAIKNTHKVADAVYDSMAQEKDETIFRREDDGYLCVIWYGTIAVVVGMGSKMVRYKVKELYHKSDGIVVITDNASVKRYSDKVKKATVIFADSTTSQEITAITDSLSGILDGFVQDTTNANSGSVRDGMAGSGSYAIPEDFVQNTGGKYRAKIATRSRSCVQCRAHFTIWTTSLDRESFYSAQDDFAAFDTLYQLGRKPAVMLNTNISFSPKTPRIIHSAQCPQCGHATAVEFDDFVARTKG